jgi:hypothetical protein
MKKYLIALLTVALILGGVCKKFIKEELVSNRLMIITNDVFRRSWGSAYAPLCYKFDNEQLTPCNGTDEFILGDQFNYSFIIRMIAV